MKENLLFQIKDGEIVPPYTSKVKKMRVMRNEILPINATLKIKDSKIFEMIINNGSCKGKSKFSVYGNRENGGMKVYNLAVEEIQEISKGNIPQKWIEKLNDRKMLEDEEMLETKKNEEAALVEETVEMVAGENEKDSMEEVIKIIDSMSDSEEDVEIDMNEVDVSENTATLPEDIATARKDEDNEQTEKTLSDDERNALLDKEQPITEKDKYVTLCYCDGHRIEMQIIVRGDSKIMDGAHFYVVDEKTNKRYIGARGCLKFSADKISNADNFEIMSFLNKFDLKISMDELEIAFGRAKEFILISKEKMNDGEVDVETAFEWFKELVLAKAAEEESLGYKERNYKVNEKAGTAQVNVDRFQMTLDEAGTNYKRIQFCKALRMVENSTGKKIIEANRQNGYCYNDSKNRPWFKFNIGSIA